LANLFAIVGAWDGQKAMDISRIMSDSRKGVRFPGFERAGWSLYEQLDASRRLQGQMLEAMGYGVAPTPFRTILYRPGVTLKRLGEVVSRPCVLLVPAPIKRAYIWDLAPGASVAQRCIAAGLGVYLVQWEAPPPGAPGPGLSEYGDRLLLECVNAVQQDSGESQVFLAGHSLGGTLCAIFSALHPERILGLIALTSPMHLDFRSETGALGPVIGELVEDAVLENSPSHVPGSFVSAISFMAAPSVFGRERIMDWLASLADAESAATHLRVERWSLDEIPLARRFVEDLIQAFYREDGFIRGTLKSKGIPAAARQIVAPVAVVADRRCTIVPPASTLPLLETVASTDRTLLWYPGDTGVAIQHVGVLVGRQGLGTVWKQLIAWMQARAAPA